MRFLYRVIRLHEGLRESAVSMVSSRLVDRYALFCDFDGSPVGSSVMSGYRIARCCLRLLGNCSDINFLVFVFCQGIIMKGIVVPVDK